MTTFDVRDFGRLGESIYIYIYSWYGWLVLDKPFPSGEGNPPHWLRVGAFSIDGLLVAPTGSEIGGNGMLRFTYLIIRWRRKGLKVFASPRQKPGMLGVRVCAHIQLSAQPTSNSPAPPGGPLPSPQLTLRAPDHSIGALRLRVDKRRATRVTGTSNLGDTGGR